MTEWATRRRRAEKAEKLHRTPAARTIARMMTSGRDRLTKAETITIAAIENALPVLVSTRELIDDFQAIIRKRTATALDQWLEAARESLISSFANGMSKDIDAVRAAIELSWSNGQTEGQITKLKLVKRHVWTASALQAESSVKLHRRVQSCVRPVCVAHMATGPDVIRRLGPNQMSAIYVASAWNGFSSPWGQPAIITSSSALAIGGR